jgi:dihydroorotate dehydrogenase
VRGERGVDPGRPPRPLVDEGGVGLEQVGPGRDPLDSVVRAGDATDADQHHVVADLATVLELDGIVATNTTIGRDGLASSSDEVAAAGAGGLSGRPLRARATDVVRLLRERVGRDMVLIGVGGISTPEDAAERLAAGADLLQAYTAFIYEGPWWPARMNAALARTARSPQESR